MMYFLLLLFCLVVLSIKVNACRNLIFDMYTLLSKRMAHLESVVQLAQSEIVGRNVVKDNVSASDMASDMASSAKSLNHEQTFVATQHLSEPASDVPLQKNLPPDVPNGPPDVPNGPLIPDGPLVIPGPLIALKSIDGSSESPPTGASALPDDFVSNFIVEVEKKKKRSTKKQELK